MTNKPALQKTFKGILHTAMKVQERINFTRKVDNQKRIKKESNTAKIKKNDMNNYIPFNNNSEC
jgi:hypothetical protein